MRGAGPVSCPCPPGRRRGDSAARLVADLNSPIRDKLSLFDFDANVAPPARHPPMRLFRLAKILRVSSRYGLDEMILEHEPSGRLAALSRIFHFWRRFDTPPAVR